MHPAHVPSRELLAISSTLRWRKDIPEGPQKFPLSLPVADREHDIPPCMQWVFAVPYN